MHVQRQCHRWVNARWYFAFKWEPVARMQQRWDDLQKSTVRSAAGVAVSLALAKALDCFNQDSDAQRDMLALAASRAGRVAGKRPANSSKSGKMTMLKNPTCACHGTCADLFLKKDVEAGSCPITRLALPDALLGSVAQR